MVKEKFQHDCNLCQFIGYHVDYNQKRYDLYYCADAIPFPTAVIRYGDEGEEFISGPFKSANIHPVLVEAWNLIKLLKLEDEIKEKI